MQNKATKKALLGVLALLGAVQPFLASAQSHFEYRKLTKGVSVSATPAGATPGAPPGTPPGAPQVSLSAAALPFGSVTSGLSQSASVLLSNLGTAALDFGTPSVLVSGAAFTAETSCLLSLQPGGTCAATVTFAPNNAGDYAGALVFRTSNTPPVEVSLSGTATLQPVTLGTFSVPQKVYSDPAFSLVPPSSNSSGTWSYTSSNEAVASVAGGLVTINGAGTTTLTATQSAAGPFAGGSASAVLTVAKATPALGQWPDISQAYSGTPLVLTPPSSTSAGAWTYTSSNPAVATVSGNTVTLVTAGTTTLTGTQAGTANYLASSTSRTLVVTPATPVVQAWGSSTVASGASLTLTPPDSNSSGTWTFSSDNPLVASVSGNVLTGVSQGTATLTATQAPSAQYSGASVTAQVTVTAPPAATDPYWAQTRLLMRFDSTPFVVQGTSTGTLVSQAATLATNVVAPSFGQSAYHNGAANPTQVTGAGNGGIYEPGSGDFTIEGWYTRASTGTSLVSTYQWNGGYKGGWSVSNNANGRIQFVGALGTATTDAVLALGSTVVPLNTWTHFAVTRQGNTLRIFIDGNLDAATTVSGALRPACYSGSSCHALNLRIGSVITDGGTYVNKHNGYLDDIRITMGVARYTSNFTRPTQPVPAN